MPQVVEADVCIIGSGITAALVAEKLTAERNARVVVVEAGDHVTPLGERGRLRQRFLDYGENPWPGDHLDGLDPEHIQSRSMCVGGLAMHWGGVTPRFTPEDFRLRSLYGVGDDWPITFEDLEPFYQEAEERMGVAGEQGPPAYDPRSKPYPQPPLPLSYNLQQLKPWGEQTGIAFWSQPSAKNSVAYGGRPVCCRSDTCSPICPIGAKYSPDFTWAALTAADQVRLVTRTIVRRLVLEASSDRVSHAVAVNRDDPTREMQFHARAFVVAGGYVWSPHLLLLSANSRFPNGLANRSGLVGKYMNGHRNVFAFITLPIRLYPGLNEQHSLMSHQFMRPGRLARYIRHDLRIWESAAGGQPRLRDDDGRALLGDEILADWRRRTERGTARVRAYYDVLPHRESSVTLDAERRTPWGDPLPRIRYRDSEDSAALRGYTEDTIKNLFQRMARAGDGQIIRMGADDFQDHPAGGCRMGSDPATSVCDSYGRTHDHENLFVVGAPTCVTGGCANGTLTFVALGLRSVAAIGEGFPKRAPEAA
jgi:choline dehydrogenase-like flavoprotein